MIPSRGSASVYTSRQINTNFDINGTPDRPAIVAALGVSATQPRPVLECSLGIKGPRGADTFTENVVIQHLDFYDPQGDPSVTGQPSAHFTAIGMVDGSPGGNHVCIEDCRFRFCRAGIEAQELSRPAVAFMTFVVNRCTFARCYGQNYQMYAYAVHDLLVENCVFYHGGWMEPTDGWGGYPPNFMRHNIYIGEDHINEPSPRNVRLKNVLSVAAAAWGCEGRIGGSVEDCAFVGNPYSCFLAGNDAAADMAGNIFDRVIVDAGGYSWAPLAPNNDLAGGGLQSITCRTVTFRNVAMVNMPSAANVIRIDTKSTNRQDPIVATEARLDHVFQGPGWILRPQTDAIQTQRPPAPPPIIYGSITPVPANNLWNVTTYAQKLGFASFDELMQKIIENRDGNQVVSTDAHEINNAAAAAGVLAH